MAQRKAMWILAIAATVATASCGILTAPVSLPAAVAENATITFKGTVVDNNGKPLGGVVSRLENRHHFWTPIAGSRDVYDHMLRRVDQEFTDRRMGTLTKELI